ncbi:TetR/AcrR family transcriptional regulator [Propionibacterium freudenreichii]|uniref:TetR/AcrR family transcriptional regulator n=1 Tax=Propionibacterium freudenreichii TaxID=1744 RepID=UPI00254A35CC|nr:TetR/AcrR family transcriptional regulator [Propionibacterium freudenreichii]MDK9647285.1 TetR/AcrR family transcriptional regulator [Propionibacterium freudenreichii]MDK9655578.1 TetR/AcrR family transcriptional regulator [Propionibacterium freudenreichii]MDK9666670.1 TetR/AcrR family transcriptional regulator [Propionibacterium freudenreichii]
MTLRRYPKGSAKRLEILDAALEVFTTEGYRARSLRGIAERAHITPAGIMHYFDSKEQLLSTVLQHRDAMDVRRADLDTPTNPVETLAQVMDANMKVPGLVTLYLTIAAAAVDPHHPAHDYLERRYRRLAGGLTAWITEMSQAGLVPKVVYPAGVATAIVAQADGIQFQWLLDPSVDMGMHVRRGGRRLLGLPFDKPIPQLPNPWTMRRALQLYPVTMVTGERVGEAPVGH